MKHDWVGVRVCVQQLASRKVHVQLHAVPVFANEPKTSVVAVGEFGNVFVDCAFRALPRPCILGADAESVGSTPNSDNVCAESAT